MHPCCNGSLQNGTKNVAILLIVFSILIIIFGVLALAIGTAGGGAVTRSLVEAEVEKETKGLTENFDSTHSRKTPTAKEIKDALTLTSVFLFVAGTVGLLQSLLLLTGAIKRNRTMCMIWFILSAISLFISLMASIQGFTSKEFEFDSHTFGRIGGLVLHCYFLWVVWAFMSELKEEAQRTARAPIARTPCVHINKATV